ncbi:hypothetical protein ACFL17_03720 [Pseudomonadota bacterium]
MQSGTNSILAHLLGMVMNTPASPPEYGRVTDLPETGIPHHHTEKLAVRIYAICMP